MSDCNQNLSVLTNINRSPKWEISWISVQWESLCSLHADGMTKLIDTLHSCSVNPLKSAIIIRRSWFISYISTFYINFSVSKNLIWWMPCKILNSQIGFDDDSFVFDMMPCWLVSSYQRLEGTYILLCQAVSFSKTSVTASQYGLMSQKTEYYCMSIKDGRKE